ncbi:MAG: PEP-CTERM sorting domain-containing protein [Candidatus Acidiferrales bacterium]
MKCMRFLFLLLLLMGSAALAYADGVPVDPLMDVSDPLCTPESNCPSPIHAGQGFQFTSDAAGGGVFTATNMTGATWSTLEFLFPNTVTGIFTCTSGGPNIPYQQGCASPIPAGEGMQSLTFVSACPTGIELCTQRPGIQNGFVFTVTLGSWPVGTLIRALPNGQSVSSFVTLTSTSVPEPGTITLLGAGLAALVVKRRFRSQLQSRS